MFVYDIEVYAVEDEIENLFNDEVDYCKSRISEYCTGQYGVNAYNLLIAGPIGMGKTSFCRSVDVAYAEKIQHEVGPIGSQDESVTNKVFRQTIRPKDGFYIDLYDIRGFEDNRGYFNELEFLLDGKLIDSYQFPDKMEDLSIDCLKDEVNVKPTDRIHALCIVLDATKVDIMTPKTLEHIRWIKKTAYDRAVKNNSKAIKKSLVARQIMENLADKTGISIDNIFPVINYTSDATMDETKNMLALRAFAKMVQQADTFVRQHTVKHRTEYVHTLLKSVEKRGLNVLCVGKVTTGKSFFIDSVMSTMRGRLAHKASGGLLRETDDSSRGTQKFLWLTLSITDLRKCTHRTDVKCIDMPGFDNDNAEDIIQIRNVIEGHCPEDYALVNRIDNNTEEYIQNPKWHNKAHVVCFVVDDLSLKTSPKEIEKLQSIISDILVPKDIPYVVVLTKIDKIGDTDRSAVSKVSTLFGVKVGLVHTVQNYVNEETVEEAIDLPILKVLQAIMEE